MITVMKIKYPRTFHFAFSQGVASDDKIIKSTSAFIGQRVIVSSKMDGENTNLYHDYIHARSLESANHISQEWVKNWHGSFKHEIPTNLRIAGENLYACHSIFYDDLPHYFLGFSVWDGNTCLSWDDTIEWFNLLNITPVKVLYDGIYDEQLISNLYKSMNLEKQEGYVCRLADSFDISEFNTKVAKFVRKGHVQTDIHWKNQKIIPNKLKIS